jgi:hypothetical protein
MRERIVCAAIFRTCATPIICGVRHSDCLEIMKRLWLPKGLGVQGFMTSRGRFVSRKKAYQIAKRSNQIKRQTGEKGVLYSEDIY